MQGKPFNFQNYIGGTWCEAVSGATMEQVNPANGEIVTVVPSSDEADTLTAVAASKEAFEKTAWAYTPRMRSDALFAWSAAIKKNIDELARILTLETGKPFKEARGELFGAIAYLDYNAAAARTIYGSSTSTRENMYSILSREPVGVVGVIVPWNYPVLLLMRDLAPALAAGNTAVIKPAEQTSGATAACIRLLAELDVFPKGVVNLVSGVGGVAGMALVRDPNVAMISFTGGSRTGKTIMAEGSNTMKKLSLELGGKSANIVFDDADLARAVPTAVSSIFENAGQLCTAASRLLVQESVADEVIAAVKEKTERLVVGDGLDEKTDMGPVSSKKQMETVLRYLDLGKETGETITGGFRLTDGGKKDGCFIAPTIFKNPALDSPVVQEEIFGPVLVVQTFKDEQEAVEIANCTRYGLASGVWSRDINRALGVARRMKAGTAWVNTYNTFIQEAETGGYKESGIDRAGGVEGLMKYTQIKHICVQLDEI